jgi:hypothetical protein
MVSDADLCAAVARRSRASRVRVLRRTPFLGGGSGARFERVLLEVDGAQRAAVLKGIAPDPLGPTRERRFYEEIAPSLPLRVPALYASGPLPGESDGWILLEPLPERAPLRLDAARLRALASDVARGHAAFLGRAPAWLPRPLGRDAREALAHVEPGIARLRERMRRAPALRFLAGERAIDAALCIARDPSPLVRAAARAPETLIHRDLHHHNVALGDPDGAVFFDWEAVSAGPGLFDLALLHIYQRTRAVQLPGGRRLYRWGRPALDWPALLAHYLEALRGAAPSVDCDAVAAAAPAALAWEAVHRLGWVDSQLSELAPAAALRARLPLLGAVEGARAGPVMLRVWRALFAILPSQADALGVWS